MIALWALYALAFGAVLGGATLALERVALLRRVPTRGIWLVAFVASWMLPVALALVPRAPAPLLPPSREVRAGGAAAVAAGSPTRRPPRIRSGRAHDLDPLGVPLLVLWGASTLLLLGALGRRVASQRGARRGWARREVDGSSILVAGEVGPAVVGVRRLQIVLPEWAMRGDPVALRLMLRHEQQHVRARDPNVLLVAAMAVVLMPWNAVLWWQLRRLRLAIEVDCDARVLGLGEDVHRYGSLLLDVASRYAGPPLLSGAAFSESASHLSRRIDAMSAPRPRRPMLRAAGFGALGALAIVVACVAPRPQPIRSAAPAGQFFPPATTMRRPQNMSRVTRAQMTAAIARYFPDVLRGDTGVLPLQFVLDFDGRIVSASRGYGADSLYPDERLQAKHGESVLAGIYGPAPVRVQVRWLRPDSLLGRSARQAGVTYSSFESSGPQADTLGARLESQVRRALRTHTELMRGLRSEDTAFIWLVLSATGDVVRAGRAASVAATRQEAHLPAVSAYFMKPYPRGEVAPWAVVVTAAWEKP